MINEKLFVKNFDNFFGVKETTDVSGLLMEKVMQNDIEMYKSFNKKVLSKSMIDEDERLRDDFLNVYLQNYSINKKLGQFFTPPVLSNAIASISTPEYDAIRSAKLIKKYLTDFVQDKDKLKSIEYFLKSKNIFNINPLEATETLTTIINDLNNPKELTEARELIRLPKIAYEPAAGTGTMLISAWYNFKSWIVPYYYNSGMFIGVLQELSKPTLPFLLFNLAYRGIHALVINGDTLTGECFDIYTCTTPDWFYNDPKILSYGIIKKHKKDDLKQLSKMFFGDENYLKVRF